MKTTPEKRKEVLHAIVSYVPVLHAGYLEFFKRHGKGFFDDTVLYVLGNDFLKEFEHLGRDLRALPPEDIATAIRSLGTFSDVQVLNHASLNILLNLSCVIVMPDEDVSRKIAEQYFKGKEIRFDPFFLRWDMTNVFKKQEILPDVAISREAFDREVMSYAFAIAEKSPDWWRQVGACAVKDGKVVIAKCNTHMPHEQSLYVFGDPRGNFGFGENVGATAALHAEKAVIDHAACEGIPLRGAFLWVSTFPCHLCAMDIAMSGFSKVYYGEGYSLTGAQEILKAKSVELIRVEKE